MTIEQHAADHLYRGQYDQASALYQQLCSTHPDRLDHHWHLGLCALLAGQIWQAQWIWQSTIEAAPASTQDRLWLDLQHWLRHQATDRQERGDLPQAERILEQLLELEQEGSLYQALGQIRMEVKEYGSAIDLLQKAIALDPAHALAHHQLGVCLKITGQISAANTSFHRAAQLQPTWIDPRVEWVHCLLAQGQIEAAQAVLTESLQIAPTDVNLQVMMADLHRRHGDLDAVQDRLSQAVQLDGEFFQSVCRSAPDQTQIFQLLLTPDRTPEQDRHLHQLLNQAIPSPIDSASDPPPAPQSPPQISHSRPDLIPMGGYAHTQNYLDQHPRQGHQISIHPPHSIQLKSPQSLDPEIPKRLRGIQISSPETSVTILNQGRVHVRPYANNPYANYGSAIITADGFLLADLSSRLPTPRFIDRPYLQAQLEHHPLLSLPSLPEPRRLSGSALVLPLGAMNYFHWMVDVIPCLALVKAVDLSFNDIDHILIHGYTGSRFQTYTLDRLQIPLDTIRNTADPNYHHCQADRLILPSLAGHISHLTFWGSGVLRDLIPTTPPQSGSSAHPRRIYISRQGAKWRRVINEAELMALLEPLGFAAIALEHYTLPEQAALMASAEIVISIHGAGLTNIVFCEPGTKVIELFPRSSILPYFWMIAQGRDLQYYTLLGEVCGSPLLCQLLNHPQLDREDIRIDLNKLSQVLKQAEIL